MQYFTSKGTEFSFYGFDDGDRPSDHFKAGDWLTCLHGCMFLASILDPHESKVLMEDDGLLHELVHLALGISISTHTDMNELLCSVTELELTYNKS